MHYEQMLLFHHSNEERVQKEIESLREQCDKVRKSIHAKHGTLQKQYNELKYEFEILKIAVCRANIN